MRRLALATCAAVALATALPSAATAQPPTDPRCLGLVAGSTGLLAVGGSIPTADTINGRPGGFGPKAPPAVAAQLPRDIVFRTNAATFGREYAFALRDGNIYVRRSKDGRALAGEVWHELELPPCLAGRVTQISADLRLLIVLGADRQIYAHAMPDGDLSPERWTWRWGPYFWLGMGMRMPGDLPSWEASEFTSDETFTDTSGRRQTPIGVATVYLLRRGGHKITYIDPWLPADESREVCGPRRGTVRLARLSASGSTVLAVSRRAEIFTRFYDFDTSGANTVFGRYSWQVERQDSNWQLPPAGWVTHADPPGNVTDAVSISRTGPDASNRLLRIAGWSRKGRPGYWEKPIAATGRAAWRFVAVPGRLPGRKLRRSGRSRWGVPLDRRFAGTIRGRPAEVRDFHAACSPATLRVEVAPGLPLDLILHSSDGLRQEPRARALDDVPREYNGAIEVPRVTYDSLGSRDPRLRAWVDANLGGRRIVTAPIAVTRTRMRFLAQCWTLTAGGRPARPDRLQLPPDLGALVGRLTEQLQDGRPVSGC